MLGLLGYYKAMNKQVPVSICLAFFGIMVVPPVTTLYFFIEKHWIFQLIAFAAGWFCWTFIEYFTNRFFGGRNDNNTDYNRIRLTASSNKFKNTLFLLLKSSVAIFFAGSSILFNSYLFFPAGVFTGFAFYNYLQIWLHHPRAAKWFGLLHTFHFQQHCKRPGICFGITLKFWDRIFNTMTKKKQNTSTHSPGFYFGIPVSNY
jgi:hypothetical protein